MNVEIVEKKIDKNNLRKNWAICSFYTPEYSKVILNLIDSIQNLNLNYIIHQVRLSNNWTANTHYKPFFLLDVLNEHPELKAVVWVDADAVIIRYPKLFDNLECDFAAHIHKTKNQLLSGTLFFKNNNSAKTLLRMWIKESSNRRGQWDQKILQETKNQWKGNFYNLPPQYCLVFDNMKQWGPPVIEHYQFSRKIRRKEVTIRSGI